MHGDGHFFPPLGLFFSPGWVGARLAQALVCAVPVRLAPPRVSPLA
jgi:hypothetical protein